MSDKRKSKKKGHQDEDVGKPTKQEYSVASYLLKNLPVKEAKLMGNVVKYFTASKAIDLLMESKFAQVDHKEYLFANRYSCSDFMTSLLYKEIFHKADKIASDKKKSKRRQKINDKDDLDKSKKSLKSKNKADDLLDSPKPAKKDDEVKKKEKKKKEIQMGMSEVQKFYDQTDAYYVWIYDPVSLKTKLIGLLLVIGSIGICMFPLWPPEVRVGVYYLSILGVGFVGVIISLSLIQRVLYAAVYLCTFGKHSFWLLPNLTEDVSFLDSFKPLYKHTITKGYRKKDSANKDSTKIEGSIEDSDAKEKENMEICNQENLSDQSNKSDDSFEIVDQDDIGDGLRPRNKEILDKELKTDAQCPKQSLKVKEEDKKHI